MTKPLNIITFLLLLFVFISHAQIKIKLFTPENTPKNDTLFIAGDFNGWNPKDVKNSFLQKSGFYYTELDLSQTISAKITRGSWISVEGDQNGNFIPNRTIVPQSDTLSLTVAGWEDMKTDDTIVTNPQITIIDHFPMPQLNTTRTLRIYLPANYEDSNQYYPVIYMHDGQNLFDASTSFAGEWGVDESLSEMEKNGFSGLIVVGIDNGGTERINEYTPFIHPTYGGGKGEEYIQFIAETLKPFIDTTFRVLTDRSHTALGGSSLGGLISLYGLYAQPNVFSKAAVFSPAYWIVIDSLQQFMINHPITESISIYTVTGTKEYETIIDDIEKVQETLIKSIPPNSMISLVPFDDGAHQEWFWNREFPTVIQALFSTQSPLKTSINFETTIAPNPIIGEMITLLFNSNEKYATLEVWNMQGNKVKKVDSILSNESLWLGELPNGSYIFKLITKEGVLTKTAIIRREN